MIERIRTAPAGTIGAVACYEQDRLHRNDRAFLDFMAEMTERRILVFDINGLVSGVNKVPWKVMAIVAQDMREKLSQRVRDNLRFLAEGGKLLGHAPVGYRRENGKLVLDEAAVPIVRRIFDAYASGKYSLRGLATYLNAEGIRPPTNADLPKGKDIFTENLLKGLLANPAYLGKVRTREGLKDGMHPALIVEATFERCQSVRIINKRRSVPYKHHRHSYVLTPLLRCARCGGTVCGRTKPERKLKHYVCARRRERLCDLPFMRAEVLEAAVRGELQRFVPNANLDEALRNRLTAGIEKSPDAKKMLKARLRSLDERVARVKVMFELGTIDQAEYVERLSNINAERQAARQEAAAARQSFDIEWCESQVLDLLRVWELADSGQRTRLLAAIFDRIEVDAHRVSAKTQAGCALDLQVIPKAGWRPYFERVLNTEPGGVQSCARPGLDTRVHTGPSRIRIGYRLTA